MYAILLQQLENFVEWKIVVVENYNLLSGKVGKKVGNCAIYN